jgi:hypothetical protein
VSERRPAAIERRHMHAIETGCLYDVTEILDGEEWCTVLPARTPVANRGSFRGCPCSLDQIGRAG